MNIEEIIQQLQSERGRIDAAIAALEGSKTGARRGRRPGKAAKAAAATGAKRRGRPAMSEAERKRLSVQMKKRWAERKAAQAKAAKA